MDQLQCHLTPSIRAAFARTRIHVLYMYSETAPECSPLDAGFFAVLKAHFRAEFTKVSVDRRNADGMINAVKVALQLSLPSAVAYFRHCGYGKARGDADIPNPAREGSLTLPFGRIPVGAKLTRQQKAFLAHESKGRGRPRRKKL